MDKDKVVRIVQQSFNSDICMQWKSKHRLDKPRYRKCVSHIIERCDVDNLEVLECLLPHELPY